MLRQLYTLISPAMLCLAFAAAAPTAFASSFDLLYRAEIKPETGRAHVEIRLAGQQLPGKLKLHLDPDRHLELETDGDLVLDGDKAVWRPEGESASLHYQFVIDEQKGSGSYDSRVTDKWAILRSDKLVPPISATMNTDLKADTRLELVLPDGWSSALPYEEIRDELYRVKDPGRRFKRPKGWMIVGQIGSRQDIIDGVDTTVAAPLGQNVRRQDTLAFLNWTLPELKKVFTGFPDHLLIISADDPMWRGGLSGTRSLFMHSDRPLVSGNRTSSMIHELVHVATGIRGDHQSDWIVEGLAEFYSLEILRRTGGISERRYQGAVDELEEWGKEAPTLLVKRSSGPITARAVGIMRQLDREIRSASGGEASIDDVARALAEDRGKVTLERFRKLAEEAAGRPVKALDKHNLRDANQ
ncbi:hypothetical protein [Microbulbifer yueqingensis]|uniref:Peptidase M61 catalytic domain-containing protein n=1 Tax=Microbulbifer yueqingensis TaxID=658219 RepID=A0A1G9A077_9GAMM|nr:hypothetical protein [Microbulbifer yueqingensis]SDK20607.1 hypothetical protein SAMN05216212_1806 [Microbulbifer yueqingensis]